MWCTRALRNYRFTCQTARLRRRLPPSVCRRDGGLKPAVTPGVWRARAREQRTPLSCPSLAVHGEMLLQRCVDLGPCLRPVAFHLLRRWRRQIGAFSARGSPRRIFECPLATHARGVERRTALPRLLPPSALCGAWGGPRHAARRETRRRAALRCGFSVPGAVLPWGANRGEPRTRAASAARRRPSVQPSKAAGPSAGGRLAEASRPCGYEPQRWAPHPAPPSGSSLEDAPRSSRTQCD